MVTERWMLERPMFTSILRRSAVLIAVLTLAGCTPSGGAATGTAAPPSATATTPGATGAGASPSNGASQAPYPTVSLSVGYAGTDFYSSTILVAQEAGFWQKYGLEVALTLIESESAAMAALQNDQVHVTVLGGTELVRAAIAGVDALAIAAQNTQVNDIFVVRPDIASADDLRGKKLGINEFGGSTEFNMKRVVQALGLNETDVTLVQVGNEGARLAALNAGTISGTFQTLGTEQQMESLGLRVMLKTLDLKIPTMANGFLVKREWLDANRDVADRLLRGLVEAIAYYKTNKEGTLPIASKWVGEADLAVVGQYWESVAPVAPDRVPLVTPEGMQSSIDFVALDTPEANDLDASRLYDNSFLEALQSSGFVDALYQ